MPVASMAPPRSRRASRPKPRCDLCEQRVGLALEDLEHQQALDAKRHADWPCLHQRHLAVLDAKEAVEREEEGAVWALRQALLDLSSVCQTMAATMPVPRVRGNRS